MVPSQSAMAQYQLPLNSAVRADAYEASIRANHRSLSVSPSRSKIVSY